MCAPLNKRVDAACKAITALHRAGKDTTSYDYLALRYRLTACVIRAMVKTSRRRSAATLSASATEKIAS
jgi:hypothetical protein